MSTLINHDNLKFVNRSMASRIYVQNKPALTDPIMDKLTIIAIPKEDNKSFEVGQKLTAFSAYSRKVFQNITFTIFDDLNLELLNEYRKIDTDKYDYFAVIHDSEFTLH